MDRHRIPTDQLIEIYQIEIEFFNELESCGLIQTEVQDEVSYLRFEDLSQFEKLLNLHYDLEVNVPGLEIITRLLSQIQSLQQENRRLSRAHF